ncbi:MAG TPA: hypothetical protein VNE00_10565 [Paraburkholderia sp.]|nr:hypothetical protein [Paraburkholderia sp.]
MLSMLGTLAGKHRLGFALRAGIAVGRGQIGLRLLQIGERSCVRNRSSRLPLCAAAGSDTHNRAVAAQPPAVVFAQLQWALGATIAFRMLSFVHACALHA